MLTFRLRLWKTRRTATLAGFALNLASLTSALVSPTVVSALNVAEFDPPHSVNPNSDNCNDALTPDRYLVRVARESRAKMSEIAAQLEAGGIKIISTIERFGVFVIELPTEVNAGTAPEPSKLLADIGLIPGVSGVRREMTAELRQPETYVLRLDDRYPPEQTIALLQSLGAEEILPMLKLGLVSFKTDRQSVIDTLRNAPGINRIISGLDEPYGRLP